MADGQGRARGRAGLRSGGRSTAQTRSNPGNDSNSRRNTLVKRRLHLFPDPDNETPRVMLKRVIQTQPPVSPLALQISNHEETKEVQSELPSKRVSSMGGVELPNLSAEEKSVTVFHMTKKRKKLSISEFERAADRRLPHKEAQTTLDSTVLVRSLRMSVGSLMAPDTVEKRGLLRRPKNHKTIDMEAFEGGVEQNMLKNKAQNYLVDSQSASGIRTTVMTSDAEIVLNNTELFVQPQLDEQSQDKLSAPELQLSDTKSSAQRSKISDAAQEKARPEGLVSTVGTAEGSIQRHSYNSSFDCEHGDRMTRVSPETPANQQEDQQDYSQQGNPMEQVSVYEEEVVGFVCRRSSSLSSRSPSIHLGSLVTLNRSSMSLREVVSHIIEDLEINDKEEEVLNTVNGVEWEKLSREAAEHGESAGYSEHLEKKLPEKAELQITAAQDTRGKTEVAPSAGEALAEGSVGPHGSARAEPEMARGVGAKSLDRHSDALSSSEKSGMNPLEETDDQDVLEDQAIMLELDDPEEEPAEDETAHPASQVKKFKSEVRQCRLYLEETAMSSSQQKREVSMETPAFVRAAALDPLLSIPRVAKPATPKSPLQLPRPKPVPKRLKTSQRKPREPQVARSLIKKIFSHFVKMPVTRDAFKVVEKCSERFFRQLSNDLEAYTNHAGRKTVEMADLELLMRRLVLPNKVPLLLLLHERILGIRTDSSSPKQKELHLGLSSPNSGIPGQHLDELFSKLLHCCFVFWAPSAAPSPA